MTLLSGCEYSRIQQLEERVQVARGEIEVELRRRAELVPSLLETVDEYGSVPEDIVARVVAERVRVLEAVGAGDLEAMQRASGALSEALRSLLATATLDPGLRDSAGFRVLTNQLEGTQQRIATAGDSYNEAVERFNAYITDFPQVVTAKVIGAEKLKPIELDGEAAEPSLGDR